MQTLPFDPATARIRIDGKHVIETIDMHTGGEPLRVILNGMPELKAESVLEARGIMQDMHDHLRTALMHEPRGHHDMYGLMLLPPERPDSAFGVLFMHNAGYSTMCGHATIAIARLAVEQGWVPATPPETHFNIDAPCGQIRCFVRSNGQQVLSVAFENVPSFVVAPDQSVELDSGEPVSYDLAYGGAFYAYVDAAQFGVEIMPENTRFFIDKGMEIKRAVASQSSLIVHPAEPELGFLYGTIFIEPSPTEGTHSRNICIFADGEVDRSPTGSGISGRAAINHMRGEMDINQPITIESVIGSTMTVEVVRQVRFGSREAVIPRVSGKAWVTGQHRFVIDPDDPFKDGFLLKG